MLAFLPTEQEAATLANAMKGLCFVPEPAVQPRISQKGRSYTPPLGRAEVQRVLNLSNFDWRNIRGLTRSLVRLHHLDVKDQGKTIRWPEKNPRNKAAAQKKLEEHFPVLARCQGSWGSDYFLRTHTNNKVENKTAIQTVQSSTTATTPLRTQQSSSALQVSSASSRIISPPASRATAPGGSSLVSSGASQAAPQTQYQSQQPNSQLQCNTRVSVTAPSIVSNHSRVQSAVETGLAPGPGVASLQYIPALRSQALVSQSRSPSPHVSLSCDTNVAHNEHPLPNEAAGPSQPAAKRAKTTSAGRGRGRPRAATKAVAPKKQTKAELAAAYERLLRENEAMRGTLENQTTDSQGGSLASSRTGTPQ